MSLCIFSFAFAVCVCYSRTSYAYYVRVCACMYTCKMAWRVVCFFHFGTYIIFCGVIFSSIRLYFSILYSRFCILLCCGSRLLRSRICLCIFIFTTGWHRGSQASKQSTHTVHVVLRHRYWHRQQRTTNVCVRVCVLCVYVEKIILAHEYVYGDGFSFRI